MISAMVYREDNDVRDYVSGTTVNFCDNINDSEAPWYPLTKAMGVKSCPLEQVQYLFSISIILIWCHEITILTEKRR